MVTLTWGGVSERGNTWLYLFTSSLDLEKQATYVGIVYGGRNGGRSVYRTHLRILDDQKAMCDSGYLLEVDKLKAVDSFGFQGRCFRIVNLPGGLLE